MRLFRRSRATTPERDARQLDKLLDVAASELSRNPQASLPAIAARAGLSTHDAERLTGGRTSMIRATILRGAARIGDAAFLDDGDPADQVAMLIGRVWDDQTRNLRLTHLASRGPYRASVEEALAPLRSTLRIALRSGVDTEVMRSDLPDATLAWLVEQSVWDVIDMAANRPELASDWRQLAMTHALCTSGLSWKHALDVAHTASARLAQEETGPRRRSHRPAPTPLSPAAIPPEENPS